ncbi:MAG: IclR family transcriptional regulator [Victivallaceae bacterium]|nr:IclR family transcriptional regulator [Victivallaceae bacterium]
MKDNTIPALEKAIQVLDFLGRTESGAAQTQLTASFDISPTTCYRILQTLVKYDWLTRKDSIYDLGPGLLPIASRLVNYLQRFAAVQPLLDKLAAATGLTAKISVRQGNEQVSILRAESPRPVAVSGRVGGHFPLVEGSVGGALLCKNSKNDILKLLKITTIPILEKNNPELVFERIEQCLQNGFCLNRQQNNRWNVESMSAPVYNADGSVAAAVTLLGFADDFADGRWEKLKKELTATTISCQKIIR